MSSSAETETRGGEERGRARTAAELIGLIDDAIDQLGQEVLGGAVSDAALNSSVLELHRLESRLHGEKLRRLAECDERRSCVRDAAMTTAAWLVARLGLTRGEAKTLAATAVGLRRLPRTAEALRAGRLGPGQAQVAVRALDELEESTTSRDAPNAAPPSPVQPEAGAPGNGERVGDERDDQGGEAAQEGCATETNGGEQRDGADDQADPARLSEELDALAAKQGETQNRAHLRRGLDEWARAQGSDHLEDRERRGFANRRVWLGTEPEPDGTIRLEGRLDPLGAAHVRAALDALSRPCGDGRTFQQRQADALTSLAERFLNAGDLPDVAAQRPHVVLITTPETLHDQPGAAPSDLDGFGPVSSATARQMCCDAETTTITMDCDGTVLNVGRARRDPTRAQRAAVIARDGHCIGCDAPATRCQVHHRHWWRNGGPTDLDNLVLTCWSCHHHLHHDGWQITRTGRTFRAHPPDRPAANPPHPPDRPPANPPHPPDRPPAKPPHPPDRPPAKPPHPPDRPPANPSDREPHRPPDRPPDPSAVEPSLFASLR